MGKSNLRTWVVYSDKYDPWFNLALEEFLLTGLNEDEIILYLWQNEHTVVIGRNQNAWKECRCAELEADGGKLARRLSGGGAVYHDLGNLNFTFLTTRKHYDVHRQLEVILRGAQLLGLEAEFSGRNDLVIDGRKFSGNAFYYDGNRMFHHGTVMVNTDVTRLSRYLQVSEEKIRAKGVDSVRSRVINLADVDSSLTLPVVKGAIEEGFAEIYGNAPEMRQVDTANPTLEKLRQKYASWEWRYGRTPAFDVRFQNRFPWGEIDLCLNCKNGAITDAVIFSDAMDALLIQRMAESLKGRQFAFAAVRDALSELGAGESQKNVVSDVLDWLRGKSF